MNLSDQIIRKAKVQRRRIGIGIDEVDNAIIDSLSNCKDVADVVIVGEKIEGFECYPTDKPDEKLVALLKEKAIDGIVRGNLRMGVKNRYEKLKKEFDISKIYRVSLIRDAVGREFFFGPTGLNEGYERDDKIYYIENVSNLIKKFDIVPNIGLLSPIDEEDKGLNKEADRLFDDAEYILKYLEDKEFTVQHFRKSIEKAIPNCNFVVAANGIIGNQTSRALWLIGGAGKLLFLPILTDKFVYEDTSRNEKDFSNHIIFATAWANWNL